MQPSLEQISVSFSVSSSVSPPGYTPPWHWHMINEIFLCESDRMHYLVGNTLYDIGKGDILLFNSLDVHRALPPVKEDYSRKIILFHDSFLQNWNTPDYDLLACFHYRMSDFCHLRSLDFQKYEELLNLFQKAVDATVSVHPAARLKQKLILAEILIFINEIYTVPQPGKDSPGISDDEACIRGILSYIEDKITGELTLSQLGKEFGISVNSLNNKFKKITRMTIHQFIIQRRLQRSCILLKQGKSVSESAYESGFRDLSHFIRCFKSNLGKTPREFAREKY